MPRPDGGSLEGGTDRRGPVSVPAHHHELEGGGPGVGLLLHVVVLLVPTSVHVVLCL